MQVYQVIWTKNHHTKLQQQSAHEHREQLIIGGNRCLDIMSLFLHFKVKITVFTYTVVHPCTPIHLYTCTPIDLYTYTPVHSYALVHLYICTPKHLCTCTVAHPCTLINLYIYPNVHPYILYTSKFIYFVYL